MKQKLRLRFDRSAFFLVLSNIFTIVVALLEKWSLSDVMWIYWGQSLVIGYYNWRRIRCLKQFSTVGFTINDQHVEPTRATQRQVASFFAMHYGFFHAVYFSFLCTERADLARLDILGIFVCIALFAVNHCFSFHENLAKDISRKPNIGTIMAFPYARILPMHLTILFGSHFAKNSAVTLILFLGLKTFADLIMHLIEHRAGGQPTDPPYSESASSTSSETVIQ